MNIHNVEAPVQVPLLISFFDLTAFSAFDRQFSDQELWQFVNEYYAFTDNIIDQAGGKILKFIGDAGLVIFDEFHVDEGVLALASLKEQGDEWLANHGLKTVNVVKLHFAEVMYGPLGTRHGKILDVIGKGVNVTATLKSNGFAMSPQVFRKLSKEVRQQFKKHTPPVTYIPLGERHKP